MALIFWLVFSALVGVMGFALLSAVFASGLWIVVLAVIVLVAIFDG